MRIVLAIKGLCNAPGGAERVVVELANFLANKGYDVHIVTFDKSDCESFYPVSGKIQFHFLGLGRPLEKSSLSVNIRRIIAIRRLIKSLNPNIAVAFLHSMYIPFSVSLMGLGIPIIGSEHMVPQHFISKPVDYLLLIISSFWIKRFTVLSEAIKKSFPWPFRRKAIALSVPIQLKVGRLRKSSDKKNNIVLTVGRLVPQKDQLTLIQAFQKISSEYPNWSLRIVGEGKLRNVLRREIDRNGLGERIILVGKTRKIDTEYRNADIFVLSSLYESLGLAMGEAMAFGLPVIGFADCPGVNELVTQNVNGVLVETDDRVDGLAEAIRQMILNEERRNQLGIEARNIVKSYSAEEIFKDWESFILSEASG
jgi:glycosyltransferase involved in cell wall biosynthesis